MRTIKALFTLKPHGENLCGLKAEMWLLLLRCSVMLIAGCEAAAWGFIGYLMAEASQPWIGALLIGGAVGCLIGGLDAAFVMVDLSKIRRMARPAAESRNSSGLRRVISLLRPHVTKAHLGALVRLVMVAVSLTITAPFLAQLLFSRDIAARQQGINNKALAVARAGIVSTSQQQLKALREQLRWEGESRSREIAGRGPSHRFGVGPVTKSIEDQITILQGQIADLEHKTAIDLRRFDHANPEILARQYGVALTSDGIVARFQALHEMEKIPGFLWTENAFRVLLAGFFFGLIIFKWYEPRALEIYFDEELQGAFEDFRSGSYDPFLPEPHSTSNHKVSPFWFEKWYYESAKVRERAQQLRDKVTAITARHDNFEAAAKHLAGDPGEEMEGLQSRRAEIVQALEPLRAALQKERDEVARIEVEIAQCEAELVDVPAAISSVPNIRDTAVLITKKNYWEERLREAKASLRHQTPIVVECQRKHDSKDAELHDLDAIIAASGRVLAELTKNLFDARVKAVNDLSAAQQEA